ncbi:hypothetical protein [Streptomyces sp. NPDC017529]|uniref:hypothetical protein n=1 Tax=Streptomyces sp. NPDC017529 TaxID=3365000 RepID=UPI00379F402A
MTNAIGSAQVLNHWEAGLRSVPADVWARTGLRVLILAGNELTVLPPQVGRLRASLGDMAGLRELRAQHAALTDLPVSLGRPARLRELWLRGNHLTGLPAP